MHFRVRKHVIQLIRIKYEPGKKRGVNSIVGTVPTVRPILTPELEAMLSPNEIHEFNQWLDEQRKVTILREELAALTLPETLAMAQRWFEYQQNDELTRRIAIDIKKQWLSLRRILAKREMLD